MMLRLECFHARSWGCRSRPGSPGVEPAHLTDHADAILDAMARLVNGMIQTELRLNRSSHAPRAVRQARLRQATEAALARMVRVAYV